jgi:hypothetical protein
MSMGVICCMTNADCNYDGILLSEFIDLDLQSNLWAHYRTSSAMVFELLL